MTRFSAIYFDGESTRAHAVEIRLDAAGVLHVSGLSAPVSHPVAFVRVSPRLGSTVRSIAFPDGARAESDDQAALDAITPKSHEGRLLSWVHRLESQWRWAVGAALLVPLLIAGGVRWGIPLMAKHLAEALPDALAYDLGKSTLGILDGAVLHPSSLNEQRKEALRQAFAGMAREYPRLPLSLQFRRGMGANAFALPDGTVVVTDDLCRLAKDDQQVMAVLAHEIGHIHHRHSLRIALESSSVAILVSTYFGDVAQVTTLSASLPAAYAQAHYSREHETEADLFALDYLERSGIELHHFADILSALQAEYGREEEGPATYLHSHPPTSERIQRFKPSARPEASAKAQ
jgi:Zn-dependent protease with chaperone function